MDLVHLNGGRKHAQLAPQGELASLRALRNRGRPGLKSFSFAICGDLTYSMMHAAISTLWGDEDDDDDGDADVTRTTAVVSMMDDDADDDDGADDDGDDDDDDGDGDDDDWGGGD
eukprot:7769168-Pyramimonas_sp.AAC.1